VKNYIFLIFAVIFVSSCGGRDDAVKEEKITITVDRPAESVVSDQPDVSVKKKKDIPEKTENDRKISKDDTSVKNQEAVKEKIEDIVEMLQVSRAVVGKMVKEDPKITKIAERKNITDLAEYLMENYSDEMDEITGMSKITNSRVIAFEISRHIIKRADMDQGDQTRDRTVPRPRR